MAYLIVSHDIALVHQVAQRVVVPYLDRVVEDGTAAAVIRAPLHPYTVALISALPEMEPSLRRTRIVLAGKPPSPIHPPPGCPLHPRCRGARDRCSRDRPAPAGASGLHRVACFFPGELPPASG